MHMQWVSLRVLIFGLLSLGTVTPVAAQSGSTAGSQLPDSTLSQAQLTAYATAFAAITAVREKTHAEMALPRNKTDETQRDLREKLHKQVDQILKEQNLTQAQFAKITYVISSDAAQRKTFEAILARIAPKPDTR